MDVGMYVTKRRLRKNRMTECERAAGRGVARRRPSRLHFLPSEIMLAVTLHRDVARKVNGKRE